MWGAKTQTPMFLTCGHNNVRFLCVGFDREVQETVRRGVRERHSVDNIVLEVNGLKYAYDTTFLDCASSIFTALISLIEETEFNTSLKNTLTTWGPLLRSFLNSREDQVELIFKIQELCEQQSRSKLGKAFQLILHTLYESDVLDEEAIQQWAKEVRNAGDVDKALLQQCEPFLRWLAEAEEESSDNAEDN
jgi:translation initiation factor eIF-2B subunit epsilon